MTTPTDLHCTVCDKTFQRPTALKSHERSKAHLMKANLLNELNSKICEKCNQLYLLINFDSHYENCKGNFRQMCMECGKPFKTISGLESHKTREHNEIIKCIPKEKIIKEKIGKKFDDITYSAYVGERKEAYRKSVEEYFDEYRDEIKTCISKAIKKFKSIKYSLCLNLTFLRFGNRRNSLNIDLRIYYRYLFSEVFDNEVDLLRELQRPLYLFSKFLLQLILI